MAFFNSLIYTSTRIAGQQERQTQAYEAGTAYFPRDFPSNAAYDVYAQEREENEKHAWERKPPAKRINYETIGTSNPWRAYWDSVLDIAEDPQESDGFSFVSTQRESTTKTPAAAVRPWLLRGPEVRRILSSVSSVFNGAAALHSEVNRIRLKRGHEPLPDALKAADLLQGALVNVKINMCSRGAPDDLAMIYALPDDLARHWEKFLRVQKSRASDLETPEELEV